ncbi:MAG: hypothetical protein JWM80_1496, partial [Cyanobacteria bacterium RYN_339]|nr:hypothetical protein [Cyanobacteria bacterium RYN_339]
MQRFRLLGILGQGAMGTVHEALDLATGQGVALKLMRAGGRSALALQQEFRQMTALRHPNCCAVYDYGVTPAGEPFFTMELVSGQALGDLAPLAPEAFVPLFAQLLAALDHVHRAGYVHLDVKGANVRVTPDGQLKLMDYGLMERAGLGARALRGTPAAMAPELIGRAPVDRRADLYAAGVLAYELLAGRPPFGGTTAADLLHAHLGAVPPPLPGVPADLARVVLKLLAKRPGDRYQDAGEVLAELGIEAPAPGDGLLSAPVVGREAELAGFVELIEAIAAGQPGGVSLLTGPAGVGKTRLLDELRVQAQLANVPFARVGCQAQGPPGGALAALLRGLLPALRERAPAALEAAMPVLARLLPELGAAPASPLEAAQREALRLHAAVQALFEALGPVVVAFDAWEHADRPSQEAVAALRRELADSPMLLVLASREGPPNLAGLAPDATARLVAAILGEAAVPPDFAAGLHALTAGNPRLVEAVLVHLARTDRLVRRGRRWNLLIDPAAGLPGDLNLLVLAQLAALPPDARAVAGALAVAGQAGSIDVVQAVTGLPDLALFEALDALTERQVVAGGLRFAQQAFPEALLAGLPAAERAALHGRVAEALAMGAPPPKAQEAGLLAAIAAHALAGAHAALAVPHALEAGRRALALFALADATRYLEGGLGLLAPDDARRPAFLRLLGEASRQAGQGQQAIAYLAAATAASPADGRLLTDLAKAHQLQSDYGAALELLARSERACKVAGDAAGAARALLATARIHFFQGFIAAALEAAQAAVAEARAGREPAVLGNAIAFLGYLVASATPADRDRGVAYLEEAVGLLEAAGDRVGLNDALNLLGSVLTGLGAFARAGEAFSACAAICRENGLREEESVALINLAITALEQGAYRDADAHARRARAIAEDVDGKLPLGMALALEGAAAAYLGNPVGADALTARAVALARGIGNRYLEAGVLPRRLEVLVHLGRLEAARAVADELEALVAATGNRQPEGA